MNECSNGEKNGVTMIFPAAISLCLWMRSLKIITQFSLASPTWCRFSIIIQSFPTLTRFRKPPVSISHTRIYLWIDSCWVLQPLHQNSASPAISSGPATPGGLRQSSIRPAMLVHVAPLLLPFGHSPLIPWTLGVIVVSRVYERGGYHPPRLHTRFQWRKHWL